MRRRSHLEAIYEMLAKRLDAVENEKRELFLAKLVLLLAHDLGDASGVAVRIEEAALNLDV